MFSLHLKTSWTCILCNWDHATKFDYLKSEMLYYINCLKVLTNLLQLMLDALISLPSLMPVRCKFWLATSGGEKLEHTLRTPASSLYLTAPYVFVRITAIPQAASRLLHVVVDKLCYIVIGKMGATCFFCWQEQWHNNSAISSKGTKRTIAKL